MKLIPLIGFKGIFGHWQREKKKRVEQRDKSVHARARVQATGRMIVHPIMSQVGGFDLIEQEVLSITSSLRNKWKDIMLTINYLNLVHWLLGWWYTDFLHAVPSDTSHSVTICPLKCKLGQWEDILLVFKPIPQKQKRETKKKNHKSVISFDFKANMKCRWLK